MEFIIAAVIAFGAYQWGASSESEQMHAHPSLNEPTTEQVLAPSYIKQDGYYIKDLTVSPVPPNGCNEPLLTTNLVEPAQDGIRSVSSVNVSCEG